MSADLQVLNAFKCLSGNEEKKHILKTLLGAVAGREECVLSGDRIHLIVSEQYSTRKVFQHDAFRQLLRQLNHPHRYSVCLTYELVHKLVLDFDCLGCKGARKEDEKCNAKIRAQVIFSHLKTTVAQILKLDRLGNVVVTQGKTHGIHVIFNDINVDRCMYRYLCHAIALKLQSDDTLKPSRFHLDEGCTSFVLPFGRNHTTIFRYICERQTLTPISPEQADPEDLSPIPKTTFPFYGLKYLDRDDGDDATSVAESCELLTTLKIDEIESLRARNSDNLKSFFHKCDHLYVHDDRSLARYKSELHTTVLPWAMIRPEKTYGGWLFTAAASDANNDIRSPKPIDVSQPRPSSSTAAAVATAEKGAAPSTTEDNRRFGYFDRAADATRAESGFVDTDVVEDRGTFRVMAGSFVRFNNDEKETVHRKYVMLENLNNVRNVICRNDIMPRELWEMILVDYFDGEIEDNKFVLAAIGYITSNAFCGEGCFTDEDKVTIMQQIIKNCIEFALFTGVLNDIYRTYKKIITKITQVSMEDAAAAVADDASTSTVLALNAPVQPSPSRTFADGTFRGNLKFCGNETDNTLKYDKIKSKNYDIFVFCASLIYYHGQAMRSSAVKYYLYYYNYVNDDTLNKILSEFVDSNVMISLVFQTACARFTKEEKLSLTTPAEMFKTVFKKLSYEEEDDDDDEDAVLAPEEYDGRDDSLSSDSYPPSTNRKRKGGIGGGTSKAKRAKKRKRIISRDLIKTLKKYFWRPFTLNGIPYMYNGNEYENASSTYKMICDTLKCTQSTFQDIFNAKKFEQQHGRNFLYKTNFYYASIKVPSVLNIVLKIQETACGGINSLLQRAYLNTEGPARSDVDIYDVVVDGLNALSDLGDDLCRSSFRFILTQPVVPSGAEENADVRAFLRAKEYGFLSLNSKDYNLCVDVLEKTKNRNKGIEDVLRHIVAVGDHKTSRALRCFSSVNCLMQVLLVCVMNAACIGEDRLDVQEIIAALFGEDGAGQVGWNAFETTSLPRTPSSPATKPTSGDAVVNVSAVVPLVSDKEPDGNAMLKNVVDLKTRIRWIFGRTKKFHGDEGTLENPAVRRVVYSIGDRFAKKYAQSLADNGNKENSEGRGGEDHDNEEDELSYKPYDEKLSRVRIRLTDKTQKTQMRYKMHNLTVHATVQKKFLKLVNYFGDEDGIRTIRKRAAENLNGELPFRVQLCGFLLTVHLYKRMPKWTLKDLPCYRKLFADRENRTDAAVDQDDVTVIIPDKLLSMITGARYDVIRWLYKVADKCAPFDFFTGFQNEYRDNILKNYIVANPHKYRRAAERLQQSADPVKEESVLLTLTYLYYMSSFDVDTLVLLLKLILSIEFPGQWSKLCVVFCGHRHAGKSKLLDILTEYAKTSATFKEPSESNKENQPGFLLYVSNMVLSQDEIATFSNTFKKIISESKIDFRNNMGNVFASIYALSKLWYTCNALPDCPYDPAIIDRILHIMVDFWHEEITNCEVGEFRYFSEIERRRIYKYARSSRGDLCSQRVLKNEGSLPFMFLQRETKIFISSMLNENAIKAGLHYISMFFSWFCFVKDIHKPVDIDIRNLPALPKKWRQQWLTQTNVYFKWKEDVKIKIQDGCNTKIPAELITASLKKYAGTDYNTLRQFMNSFEEDFGRYYNQKDNTYSLSVDIHKLI